MERSLWQIKTFMLTTTDSFYFWNAVIILLTKRIYSAREAQASTHQLLTGATTASHRDFWQYILRVVY